MYQEIVAHGIIILLLGQWTHYSSDDAEIYVKGSAHFQDQLLDQNELALFFSRNLDQIKTSEHIKVFLSRFNGFFSVIVKTDEFVLASVDRCRSYPIFYGRTKKCIYVSDDAYWVKKKIGDYTIDPLSEVEFLLTGYVTGQNTLYPNLYQVQAGEYIIIRYKDMGINFNTQRYYRFLHRDNQKSESPIHFSNNKMSEVFQRVFERFIQWADGRTLVVPLSGGHDSRLICLMLKKLEYENVVTFSYGLPGNKESIMSNQIASKLGLPWMFIPYSHKMWYQLYNSTERKKYFHYADGLSSVPHLQDWPAIREFKNKSIVSPDSVFVPGHTVALWLKGRPNKSNPDTLVDSIFSKHYCLWSHKHFSQRHLDGLRKKIWKLLEDLPDNSHEWAVNSFESWEIHERQVKFIQNSVRAYEFFGYSWYMPLLDAEFIEFWQEVPLKFRSQKKIYIDHITQLQNEILGEKLGYVGAPLAKLKSSIRNTPLASLSQKSYRNLTSFFKKRHEYYSHPMGWYGIISEKRFKEIYSGKEKFVSFCAMDRIKSNSFDDHN
jgi:asparagine synthase (glutamine-hydrolysing)